jgi:tRNA pseudouridine55 synthase
MNGFCILSTSGLIVINKPRNISSMDVIRKLRRITKIKKIGHAGTLDPLATGVLLVCIGKATKKIENLMNTQKEYIAQINLSAFTTTDDAEGDLTEVKLQKIPTLTEIKSALINFIGEINQIPPKFSAIKVNGVRAYKKANQGLDFELMPRPVSINSIEILKYQWPLLEIKVQCGKGTYIRSLARDIGKCLNTGGYITSLNRTKVGDYSLDNAINLDTLTEVNQLNLINI